MLPYFECFGFSISWYTLCQYLAVLCTSSFAIWYLIQKANFHLRLLQLIKLFLILYVLIITGGRLISFLDNFLNYHQTPNWYLIYHLPSSGNLRWAGSILLVFLLFPFISKRILKLKSYESVFDFITLCLCCLTIWLKLGCFLEGDLCRGLPTSNSWLGVHYLHSNNPSILPIIPTSIIVSLFHAILFSLLLFIDIQPKRKAGQISRIYFIIIAIFYLLIELVKKSLPVFYDFTLYQIIYIFILLGSTFSILLSSKIINLKNYKIIYNMFAKR